MGGPALVAASRTLVPIRTREVITEFQRMGFRLFGPPFTSNTRFMLGCEGGSAFNVLIETIGNEIRAFMLNPEENGSIFRFRLDNSGNPLCLDYNAGLPAYRGLSYDKTIISITEENQHTNPFIDKALQAAIELSAKKQVFWLQPHIHLRGVGNTLLNTPSGMLDDGKSSLGACALNLAFCHTDAAIFTFHNNFSSAIFRQMEKAMSEAGITLVPGMEATMPLFVRRPWLSDKENSAYPNPNGPHVLMLSATPEMASEIRGKYFSDDPFKYAPTSHARKDMRKILVELKQAYGDKVAIIFAHPVCEGALPQVGILERALFGEISIDNMLALIRDYGQGVACFNPTLDAGDMIDFGEIRTRIRQRFSEIKESHWLTLRMSNIDYAEQYVSYLLGKWGRIFGTKPSRNTINMAFAAEMNQRFGTAMVFESDSHMQNLLYLTPLEGRFFHWIRQVPDFGKGHVRIELPEGSIIKPAPEEIIRLFHSSKSKAAGGARLESSVYWEKIDEAACVQPVRDEIEGPQKLLDTVETYLGALPGQAIGIAGDCLRAFFQRMATDPAAELNGNGIIILNQGSDY